ncbi:MAG: response regulator [Calditrichaeota bacterium]|nr:response regulator [Calditrichota bacterium]
MSKILIIDDYDESIALIKTYFLGTDHTFISANNGREGLSLAKEGSPDLVLCDVIMPGMDGFEVCQNLLGSSKTKDLPIIMITGLEDNRSRSKCFELGVEYISKPFNIFDIKMRVEKLLELKNYKAQLKSAEKLIFQLALIAERKDAYAKGTNEKLAGFGTHFAKHLGLEDNEIKNIGKGALLHAVGKIEISENILSKPGPLSSEEFENIKSYPEAGEKICQSIDSLKNVLPIIRHHKEQFDGMGYPDQLSGDEIPLNAQIISIADSFNALTTNRPYREALSVTESFSAMDSELDKGKINPYLYKEFKQVFKNESIENISMDFGDITN